MGAHRERQSTWPVTGLGSTLFGLFIWATTVLFCVTGCEGIVVPPPILGTPLPATPVAAATPESSPLIALHVATFAVKSTDRTVEVTATDFDGLCAFKAAYYGFVGQRPEHRWIDYYEESQFNHYWMANLTGPDDQIWTVSCMVGQMVVSPTSRRWVTQVVLQVYYDAQQGYIYWQADPVLDTLVQPEDPDTMQPRIFAPMVR